MFRRFYANTRPIPRQTWKLVSNEFYPPKTSPLSTSSTRPSRSQYLFIADVEDLDGYNPGGYHPLQIYDTLDNGRYRLVHKLGYGAYSTVWLARDLQNARYVAVKVNIADTSDTTHESSLIHKLRSSRKPGKEIIRSILGEFWAIGPNGRHKCIVTPPAQMSLPDSKDASAFGLFEPKVAQSMIAQLIRGVAFLHDENIVHGDLHLGNILVQFPEAIDHLSTSELHGRFGRPEPDDVVRVDGKQLSDSIPPYVFLRGWFGVASNDLALGQENIILNDFGASFNPHETRMFESKTVPTLQPPEARFSNEPLSFASDIWTLACTIWEILGRYPLFEVVFPTPDRVTAEQVEALGILPPEWWDKWERRSEWFNEEGDMILKRVGGRMAWDQRFEHDIQKPRAQAGLEIVTKEERRALETMLRSMLAFRPRERATAQQALHSEWMKHWGRPALEQSGKTFKPEDKYPGIQI
ncbi:CMGC/SRPK protein kinase [Penicillium paradoxum]|uniref:CMGC/SRPK protein kinase n=1 Tax=Penicillium paradoxum TaxID=176176 RepID=UPI002549B66B|nr:CMGC/SRPK protein kinase [Penicillium paradoxum]KAJ5793784.1 CMGC/SRPK protein kinase [Penicillium paradoxum]